MRTDDSSLQPEQYRAVHEAVRKLLNRSEAWGRIPTPIEDLLRAADLQMAPMSAFDERAMLRYLQQVGQGAERILRRAIDKVLGILDVHADCIHIDPTVSKEKQTFLTFHETGHKEIPHQRGLYRWVQDCSKCLAPDTAALFEREANTFASIVLFQDDTFSKMTADSDFGIKVALKVSKNFGASVYAGLREYVRRSSEACALIVLDPTTMTPEYCMRAPVRRVEVSPTFISRFGKLTLSEHLTPSDTLMQFVPIDSRRMTAPNTFSYTNNGGEQFEFMGEGFRTPYNTFILIRAISTHPRSVSLTPIVRRLSVHASISGIAKPEKRSADQQ